MKSDFSLFSFFWSIFILLLILLSLWGWGKLICFLTKIKLASEFFYIAIGTSISIFILSFFSLLNLISISFNFFFLISGIVFWWFLVDKKTLLKNIGLNFSTLVIVFSIIFFVIPKMYWGTYNSHDDFHAYMNLPIILLKTGGMNNISFLERGIFALGGQSLLQSIFLTFCPINRIILLDAFLFYMLAVFIFNSKTILLITSSSALRNLIVIVLFSINSMIVNVSAYGTISFLFLCLAYMLSEMLQYKTNNKKMLLIITFLIGALAHLKLTTIVFSIPLCALFFFELYRKKQMQIKFLILNGFFCATGVILLLFPGMLTSYLNFGTLYFPILGKGNHISSLIEYPINFWNPTLESFFMLLWSFVKKNIGGFSIVFAFYLFLCVGFFVKKFYQKIYEKLLKSNLLLLIFSFPFSFLILSWKTKDDAIRYSYPILAFILALSISFFLILIYESKLTQKKNIYIITAFLVIIFSSTTFKFWHISKKNYFKYFSPKFFLNNEVLFREYIEAQSKIPENEKVLVFVSYPMLLDFSRNKLFLIDWGGTIGPRGPLPVFSRKDFFEYLREEKINYIMYSYFDYANFGPEFDVYLFNDYLQLREYAKYNGALRKLLLEEINLKVSFFKNSEISVIKVQ